MVASGFGESAIRENFLFVSDFFFSKKYKKFAKSNWQRETKRKEDLKVNQEEKEN